MTPRSFVEPDAPAGKAGESPATTEAGDKPAMPKEVRDEHTSYCELPFVEPGANWIAKSDWSPPAVPETEDGPSHDAECAIGTIFALDFITHLRDHASGDPASRLANVVQAVVERGKWGRVEIGFFNALGNFIESGDVFVGVGWRAAFTPRSGDTAPDPVSEPPTRAGVS